MDRHQKKFMNLAHRNLKKEKTVIKLSVFKEGSLICGIEICCKKSNIDVGNE